MFQDNLPRWGRGRGESRSLGRALLLRYIYRRGRREWNSGQQKGTFQRSDGVNLAKGRWRQVPR